jgi:hypothetical protein
MSSFTRRHPPLALLMRLGRDRASHYRSQTCDRCLGEFLEPRATTSPSFAVTSADDLRCAYLVVVGVGGGASAATPSAPRCPASAGTDPLAPYGTDPHSPYVFGYHVSDHDEANTTNGQVDVPF